MTTAILGISAFYHDSAAALLVDGEIVAAAQEERFSRKKHDHRFPTSAIDSCLAQTGLTIDDLDYVGFYDKPLMKFERLLETYLAFAPAGLRSFLQAMPIWLRQKLHVPREIRRGLQHKFNKRIVFAEHHESHAASAFYPSPFEESAILTMDGVGEWATTSFGIGQGNQIRLSHQLTFPHSLGLLYSAFTYYVGFKVNSGEYKLMGLAPYGQPKYADLILERLIDLKPDGSFRLNIDYFNFCQGLTMTSARFHRLFGRAPRSSETTITQLDKDIAASIQHVTEEIVVRCARHVREETNMTNLCLAGGVALNCVANGRILRENIFDRIWVQPAAGDAGGALGVAQLIWHQLLGKPREIGKTDSQSGSLLGPSFSTEYCKRAITELGGVYQELPSNEAVDDFIATQLADEKVVGLFQGRMEFGPRALGCRSVIGDARSPKMQRIMNLKTKFRESFRPFAPSVLHDRVSDYFDFPATQESPYMLMVAPVASKQRVPPKSSNESSDAVRELDEVRSTIPAVTHVDNSARVQTVDPERNKRYYQIIKRFEQLTGCPVIINTSFNVRGEPIVGTPGDAFRCFQATNIDVLVIENLILVKEDQPQTAASDRQQYREQFDLD